MKLNKIISVLFSLVLIITVNSFSVYAESDGEFLDLYRLCFDDNTITHLYYFNTEEDISYYTINTRLFDYAKIGFTGSATEFDCNELADFAGCNPDMFSVSYDVSEYGETKYLTVDFSTHEHTLNREIAGKLYEALKEKYEISSAYACFYSNTISKRLQVMWNTFSGKDKFGYKATPEELLSKKKINAIRNAIADNNFAVTIDDTGKILFNESISETERYRFALWFKEEYGFRPSCKTTGYRNLYNMTEIMHYTELSGDVNNDNIIDKSDVVMLNNYLLSRNIENYDDNRPYLCFNWKNADLTGDGIIDVFDLVLLKKQTFIDSGF